METRAIEPNVCTCSGFEVCKFHRDPDTLCPLLKSLLMVKLSASVLGHRCVIKGLASQTWLQVKKRSSQASASKS